MDESRMLEVAKELLNRSKEGKIKWEGGPFGNSYMVKFPDLRIIISREVNDYVLSLVNEKDRITDSLSSTSFEFTTKEVLQEIYDSARRQVLDIPSSIDKTLEYLRRE
jgi:hypothetical protein